MSRFAALKYPLIGMFGLLLSGTSGPLAAEEEAPSAPAVRVEHFNPSGTVKGVRQATARFSAPMVTLGDPRLPDPFEVDCASPGKGRWADPANWVYDFDADLPAGERCRFTARKELRSADGGALEGKRVFTFDTGGPAIKASLPGEGSSWIDEAQIFILKLDAPATQASVEAHARCVVDGLAEQIPVDVIVGAERETLLAERQNLGYQRFWLLWKDGVVSRARVKDPRWKVSEDDLVALRCRRPAPPATKLQLVWGKGITTSSGIATTQDQALAFRTRPAFTASVECSRTSARSGCLPMLPVTVSFTAPVPRAQAEAVRLETVDGRQLAPKSQQAEAAMLERIEFAPPFPADAALKVRMPEDLRDDAGRVLENRARFPLDLRVDDYPPLAKFSAKFGVLEASEGGVLPVWLRNLDVEAGKDAEPSAPRATVPARKLLVQPEGKAIVEWLRRVEESDRPSGQWVKGPPKVEKDDDEDGGYWDDMVWREDTGTRSIFADETPDKSGSDVGFETFTIDAPGGKTPLETVGIPLEKPGLHVVELESKRLGSSLLGRDDTRYVAAAALVTNQAVHFKWGRERSLVWVTSLVDAEPVPGAAIEIVDYCSGESRWTGTTDEQGIATVDTTLGEPHGGSYCSGYGTHPLLVLARTGEELSFSLSSWADGIGPYQFGLRQGSSWDLVMAHSVLDRPLFRAGETVSMQHYLRRHDMHGVQFNLQPAGARKITIRHLGSGQFFEHQVEFGADGTADQQWKIPPDAKLGDYAISITDLDGRDYSSGQFKVEQFRLPSMRASVSGPARPLVRAASTDLDLHVAYLSGGGASGMEVKLRTLVEPVPVRFADYEDFEFGGERPKEGRVSSSGQQYDIDFEAQADPATQKAREIPVTLDGQGAARVTVPDLPEFAAPARLVAEMEYADANGEILTTSARIRLLPSSLSVGIRREGWAASPEQTRFKVVVLDLDGKPKARQKVEVTLFHSESYSYRKRMIGGFYTYDTTTETTRLPVECAGRTDKQGLLICEVAPGVSGQVLLRAETKDSDGHLAGATTSIWLVGEDDWWFGGTTGDRMDLLPEQRDYESGDRARMQVRMPFRKATALVTVEREGVLSGFVTKLSGRKPVVDVPIEDRHAPNVFVSVLAVRGRVPRAEPPRKDAATEITGLVDLRKPAYRLGMTEIRVGWKPHRLDIKVTPDRSTYKIRETVDVELDVRRANGRPLPEGTELALAAVDEALLELAANPSWNLLEAMMGQRGIEVWTSTAQMQVVGKRHFGRKAVPHGGGGGRGADRAREDFDSLLLWQARVRVDAEGKARVAVPLNDSLSSFRIVAVAHSGPDLFGTGSASVATTQDLILVSGLPPLLREGDRFDATVTLRNTTDASMDVEVKAGFTDGGADGARKGFEPSVLASQMVTIKPGEARDVFWPVVVPIDVPKLDWHFEARAVGGDATDNVRIAQQVVPAYPVRTYQATITQLGKPWSLPAARPEGAIPGRGGLEIQLQDTLAGSLAGVHEYMSWYPYICLEQHLSRAVALRDRGHWDDWIARLPAYMDRDGLLRYFPSERLPGDDTLSAYVLAIAHEAGWPIADADRSRVIEALKRFIDGRVVRQSALATADLAIRKLAAIEALSRYDEANASMLGSVRIEPNLWPTSAVIDWLGVLDRVKGIPDASVRREEALNILRARLNFQGTIMTFSTERSDALWWLMISSDSNANRMLLGVLEEASWAPDVPRLVRGSLSRQQFGHWNTTVANAWGVLAMEKFSAKFESVPVTGSTGVEYGAQNTTFDWDKAAKPEVSMSDVVSGPTPSAGITLNSFLPWEEGRHDLSIAHEGTGKPWAMVRATAALPLDAPLFTGYRIQRTVTPVQQQTAGVWTRGDVARIRLELEAQTDMSWVVVDDPVPAGSTILGGGLGGRGSMLAREERDEGWVWLAYEERRFDAFRAYYRFVPKGKWVVEYSVRLNNPGEFLLPATRVEAMYAPEMFGEQPNEMFKVLPKP